MLSKINLIQLCRLIQLSHNIIQLYVTHLEFLFVIRRQSPYSDVKIWGVAQDIFLTIPIINICMFQKQRFIYSIHHWGILWSSYRKLAWVGFGPTVNEFRSDPLTDWAIRSWAQLTLRANFVQILQFHCLFGDRFHFSSFFCQSSHLFFILIKILLRSWHRCSGMNWYI